ncbi:hypothetical protein KZ686_19765 [Cupriavidus cauae]|uniref:Uncharacterized protein n=1 Tax=Cupriavidus cauae TaxID=2608999 RepID=A0A5M8B5M2_9BURK|nr:MULTISPECIES: hypothetical protein [Cupriavidus]KAA6129746.1 hypothetical protein F1599_04215 [Cupriavidus cauae]MCA7083777.1 hypothetical protein [Cupriavidus sp. DB3]UZN52297.1 hypothetical protein KZ686_19765 [Cupriavidus cauae]
MKTRLCAFAALAAFCTSAAAGSFSHLDRSDDAEIHSHTAWSNDIYVKGFGLSLGLLGAGAQDDEAPGQQSAVDDDGKTRQVARLPIDLLAASADSVGYGGGLASGCWKPASSLAPRR